MESYKFQNGGADRKFYVLYKYLYRIRNMRPVPKRQIAIARDFAFVLNDNNHQTLIGSNDNFRQLRSTERIVKVAAAFCG